MDLGVTKCFSVSTKFVRISATFWKKSIFRYATYDRWKKDWFEKDCGMKRCVKTLILNWKWIEKMRIPFNANNLSNSLSNADSSFGCLQIGNDEREKCCLTRRKTVDKLSSSFFFFVKWRAVSLVVRVKGNRQFRREIFPVFLDSLVTR